MQKLALVLISCFFACLSQGQTCTNPGQNPATAFPVCGTTTFTQSSVPLCGNRNIVGPCGNTGLTDKNPFWYKFTCFTSGTLGFIISPLAGNEDYDWQLFDVTGVANLDQVYTNPSLFVTCSWSGSYGNTGTGNGGTQPYACDGGTPLFVRMPTLVAGHDYLLMISHYTSGQSGYNLSFGGGTASITDTVPPRITAATGLCDGIRIDIKLNKQMKCASLAANGSDFSINTGLTSIIGATGYGCTGGFDLDSLQLTLNNPLPAGTYKIKVKVGNDLNTLLDLCGTAIPIDDSVDLIVPARTPVPMDSIRVNQCGPQNIELVFSQPIRCSTIAPDGSDFTVTGPSAVTVTQALGNCNGAGLTNLITVSLASPIKVGGTYNIRLKNGSDGNTLLDNCVLATPVGSNLSFVVRDSVANNFNYNIIYNTCAPTDTVKFFNSGTVGITSWAWTFNSGTPATSTQQNPVVTYTVPGTYNVKLVVKNTYCQDSITVPVAIVANPKDTVLPQLTTAIAPCEGTQIIIKLNKKIRCSSIAANGSDFGIRPASAVIASATGISCGANAETDSILVNLATNLPTGTYTLFIKNGSDGNTVLDNCNRTIPVNDSINNIAVVFHPLVTMDSITKVGCKPQELILVFKEPVRCSSIAADGSDFTINGPSAATITQALGTCTNDLTNTIKLTLGGPIVRGGSYSVALKNGSDANTLLNECNKPALAGGSRTFIASDTVSSAFTYSVTHTCFGFDSVFFFQNGANGITNWRWTFDNGSFSPLQNPIIKYFTYGTRPVSLSVSNGVCTDSVTQQIFIPSDTLHATFEAPTYLCPSEVMTLVDNSSGNITSYLWDLGDGTTSTLPTPPAHVYPIPSREMVYNIKLTITGSLGCTDDTTVKVKALNNCVIAVPSAFTPNGDGLNDYLYPTNAFKADKLLFRVYNRFGQAVFEARGMGQKWDGRVNGDPQAAGAYVWTLTYIDTDTGKSVSQKGTTVLIR